MDRFGSNRIKRVYLCPKCETFTIETWAVGNESLPPTRREYCPRCMEKTRFTIIPMERDKHA